MGYDLGQAGIDGIQGGKNSYTSKAIRDFKWAAGLDISATIDSDTLEALDKAVQAGFTKDRINEIGERYEHFGVVGWEYSQSTGYLYKIDSEGKREHIATGYSGYDKGLNNPEMENVSYVGPIPRGLWKIGPQEDSDSVGSAVMALTFLPGTETYGRFGFFIHGDNKQQNYTASRGCIILPRNIRDTISNSDSNVLRVIR